MLKTLAAVLAFALTPMLASAQETNAPASDAAAVEVQDFSIGDPAAKVKIIEYASFTCPHCADAHKTIWKDLKKNYIDTGKVYFTYREVYFDRYGLWAAIMARCGGEMRYFGIVDVLFDTQKEWSASEDPKVKDAPKAEAMVAHFKKNFDADGIEGTPSFMINGTKHSNMSYEDMAKIIDEELAK